MGCASARAAMGGTCWCWKSRRGLPLLPPASSPGGGCSPPLTARGDSRSRCVPLRAAAAPRRCPPRWTASFRTAVGVSSALGSPQPVGPRRRIRAGQPAIGSRPSCPEPTAAVAKGRGRGAAGQRGAESGARGRPRPRACSACTRQAGAPTGSRRAGFRRRLRAAARSHRRARPGACPSAARRHPPRAPAGWAPLPACSSGRSSRSSPAPTRPKWRVGARGGAGRQCAGMARSSCARSIRQNVPSASEGFGDSCKRSSWLV